MTKPVTAEALARMLARWAPATGQEKSSGPAVNLDYLREACGEDTEIIGEVMRSYVDATSPLASALEQAMVAESFEEAARLAGALEDASVSIGAIHMPAVCSRLATALRHGQLDTAGGLRSELQDAQEQLVQFIQLHLGEGLQGGGPQPRPDSRSDR